MHKYLLFVGFVLGFATAKAQTVDLFLGNKAYEEGDLTEAEARYQQSLEKNGSQFEAQYNLGNTAYKNGDFETAISQYEQAAALSKDRSQQAQAFHNLGNAHLGSKQFEESVKAYKNALRLNPNDDETRYNLAYAQKMLEQQEQQKEENQKDEEKEEQEEQEEQEKKEDKEEQDENEDGEEGENEDKKDGEEKEDDSEKKDQKNKEGNEENSDEKEEKKQPKPMNLSPREAEQMLEAAKEQDQKIQMQLKKQEDALGSRAIRFFQAEDGIRDVERSRGLGDVYKRQRFACSHLPVGFVKTQRLARVGAI